MDYLMKMLVKQFISGQIDKMDVWTKISSKYDIKYRKFSIEFNKIYTELS